MNVIFPMKYSTEWKRNLRLDKNTHSRFFGMLGFAMRAGKVVLGTDLVIGAIRANGKGKARLLLVCKDASEQTKKKLCFKAEFYEVKTLTIDLTSDELGQTLGKKGSPVCCAIIDDNFADEIAKALAE